MFYFSTTHTILIEGDGHTAHCNIPNVGYSIDKDIERNDREMLQIYQETLKPGQVDGVCVALCNRFPGLRNFGAQNAISITSTDFMVAEPSFTIANIINSIANLTAKIEDPLYPGMKEPSRFLILDVWDVGIHEYLNETISGPVPQE